jgi:hypothetical protein
MPHNHGKDKEYEKNTCLHHLKETEDSEDHGRAANTKGNRGRHRVRKAIRRGQKLGAS